MKRLNVILLVCFFSLRSFGQELTWEQKFNALNAVDSIVNAYEGLLTFTDLNNTDSIGNRSISNFRNLFVSDATIYDDLCPSIFLNNYKNPLIFSDKTIDEFLASVKINYPKGLSTATITNMNVGYKDMALRNLAYVVLEKKITATTRPIGIDLNAGLSENKWKVEITDTVLLIVELSKDYKSAKIQKISHEAGSAPGFKIMNDEDNDFVIDSKDKCDKFKGYITFYGCDYPQGPTLSALLYVGGGVTFRNSYNNLDENSPPGYDLSAGNNLDFNKNGAGFSGGVQVEYFFDMRRRCGIGAGVDFFSSKYKLAINSFKANYESRDTFGHSFEQIVSSKGRVEEQVNFSSVIPTVYGKYRTKFDQSGKWGVKVDLGLGLRISRMSKMEVTEGVFNYEAIYSLNSDGSFGFSDGTSNSNYDIKFEEDFVNSYGGDTSLFSTLSDAGYNVGLHESLVNSKLSADFLKSNFVLSLVPAATYELSKDFILNLGLQLVYDIPSTNNRNWDDHKYMLTDKKGEYNSLLAGVRTVNNTYIGIVVGVSFGLIKEQKDIDVY